jgi:hypothetical protein
MRHFNVNDFVRVTVEQVTPHIPVGAIGVVRGYVVDEHDWKVDVEFLPAGADEQSFHAILDPSHVELAELPACCTPAQVPV